MNPRINPNYHTAGPQPYRLEQYRDLNNHSIKEWPDTYSIKHQKDQFQMFRSNCKIPSNLDNLDNIFSQEIINPVHSMRQATG